MAVAINDIIRINAQFIYDGATEMENVYHFRVTRNDTANDDAFMTEIAAELDAWYQIVNVDISDRVDYSNISGINLTQVVLLPDRNWPVLVNGADSGASLPSQVAACVFFRTTRPKTRTSKFLPPYTEQSNDTNGTITAAALTVLGNFAVQLAGGITQTNVDAEYGAWNKPASRFTPVTGGFVPNRFRTQRRRRVGVGN